MKTRIIVCTHKTYPTPEDDMYLPLQMGAATHEPIIDASSIKLNDGVTTGAYIDRDDEGENISAKNDTYCELTGLYWAWKNLDADVIGLAHYRRHFSVKDYAFIHRYGRVRSVLTRAEVEALFLEYDIIVPQKRRYYIESLYSHYGHTLDASHLDMARDIIAERHPEYMPYVSRVYERTWGYMFNMMIMKRGEVDDYCLWLFDILGELEKRIGQEKISGMSVFEKRLFGRVSEILFNVWLEKKKNEGCRIGEVKYLPMESEQWGKKIPAFLAAKFTGRKYKESFK